MTISIPYWSIEWSHADTTEQNHKYGTHWKEVFVDRIIPPGTGSRTAPGPTNNDTNTPFYSNPRRADNAAIQHGHRASDAVDERQRREAESDRRARCGARSGRRWPQGFSLLYPGCWYCCCCGCCCCCCCRSTTVVAVVGAAAAASIRVLRHCEESRAASSPQSSLFALRSLFPDVGQRKTRYWTAVLGRCLWDSACGTPWWLARRRTLRYTWFSSPQGQLWTVNNYCASLGLHFYVVSDCFTLLFFPLLQNVMDTRCD